jgi:hypothetical protein
VGFGDRGDHGTEIGRSDMDEEDEDSDVMMMKKKKSVMNE